MSGLAQGGRDIRLFPQIPWPAQWPLVLCLVAVQELAYLVVSAGQFDYPLALIKVWGASAFRLFLEIQIGTAVVLLPRAGAAIATVALHASLAVATVAFRESQFLLTPSLIKSNHHEGLAALSAGVSLSGTSAAILLLFAASLALSLHLIRHLRPVQFRLRLAAAMVVVALLDACYVAAVDPPRRVLTFVSPKRLMLSYGYLGFVAVDARYLAFADSQARYRSYLSSRPGDVDSVATPLPFAPTSIYVIQWESMDPRVWSLLEPGSELQRLWEEAGRPYLLPEHYNGSSDTDYSVNTGLPTSPGINPYLLSETGMESYLPKAFEGFGYEPVFVHCNTPRFFSRGRRIAEFGYRRIYWSESFGDLSPDGIFSGLNDRPCIDHVVRDVGLHPGQFLYFVSMTSHYPYRNLPQSRDHDGGIEERYGIEMRYSADAIGRMLGLVPVGALIVVFGDHQALGLEGYQSSGRVPLICAIRASESLQACRLSAIRDMPVWQLPRHILGIIPTPNDRQEAHDPVALDRWR